MDNALTLRIVRLILAFMSIVCVFSIVYHMFNQDYKTETAIYATASESVTFQGVYLRDEILCSYGGGGVVCYNVSDGGKLGVGSVIADIYADESQIDIRQQIATLEGELALLQKIQNPGTSESAQPSNLSGLIGEAYKSLSLARERMNMDAVEAEKEQLLVLMSTYQKITTDGVDFSARIQTLTAQLSALQAQQALPMDTVKADRSAYFVSYVDGFEKKFTKGNRNNLTVADIRDVTDTVSTAGGNVIGKLIDGYEWYMAGIIDNSRSMFETDMPVRLKLESTSSPVSGVVDSIRPTENPTESIILIRCDKLTHDLVQHRTERVELIKGNYEGIKVSRDAIRFRDVSVTTKNEETGEETTETINARGVYILLGEQPVFRRLDVIYESNDYVLTSLGKGSDYVSLYDDIIVNGVNADGS